MKRIYMSMNKKGFTLVELVIVVIILGVILVFALPNITSTLERNKKDQMIIDAKDMVEKAKNYALKTNGIYPTYGCSNELKLSDIDPRNEIKDSPFGVKYSDSSYVKICLNSSSGSYEYKVYLSDDYNNRIEEVNYMDLDKAGKYNKVIIAS